MAGVIALGRAVSGIGMIIFSVACLQAAETPEAEQPAAQQAVPAQERDQKGWQLSPEGDAAILRGTEHPLSSWSVLQRGLRGQ